MTVEINVVEPDPGEGSVPVAVAEAVTPGELAARLDALETRVNERIAGAELAALDAQQQAEDAQTTAEVAAVIAEVAAEQPEVESPEQEVAHESEIEESGGEGGVSEDVEETVRPPERRSENGSQDKPAGDRKPAQNQRRYGASWLSGGR